MTNNLINLGFESNKIQSLSYLSLFKECKPMNGPLTSHHSLANLLNFWSSSLLSVEFDEYLLEICRMTGANRTASILQQRIIRFFKF